MLRSMTGFAQAEVKGQHVHTRVEIRTVNHRFAEVIVRQPRDWSAVEADVRAVVTEHISRGRAEIYLAIEPAEHGSKQVDVDWALFDALVDIHLTATNRIRERLEPVQHLDDASAFASHWLSYPDVMTVSQAKTDPTLAGAEILAAVKEACLQLVAMREREGERLSNDLRGKLGQLAELANGMALRVPNSEAQIQKRLHERMQKVAGEVDEGRWLAELAVLLDRMSIDEEIVRLRSHIAEFRESLTGESPVGRRLDFLVQEMLREVNTIGSKSADLEITKAVVDSKVLVEQMREQVQNVE